MVDWKAFRFGPVVRGNAVALLELIRTSAGDPSRLLPYMGVLGYRNLGDEILWQLAKTSFPQHRVLPSGVDFYFQKRLTERCLRLQRPFVVGGGTLLLSEPLRRVLKRVVGEGGRFVTFGTGVLDPDYWGQLSDQKAKEWSEILSSAVSLGVRGPMSLQILKDLGVRNASMVGDPAVLFTRAAPPPAVDRRVLGVNFGTTHLKLWGGSEAQPMAHLADAIRRLARDGWDVVFFCIWPQDLQSIRSLAREAGIAAPRIICEYVSPERFQLEVSRCRVFVAMKLHALILAAANGTPSLALEYRPKIRDFMSSIGAEVDVLRIDRFDGGMLAGAVSRIDADPLSFIQKQWGGCNELRMVFLRYCRELQSSIE